MKPHVDLVGEDGNAMFILARCQRAAKAVYAHRKAKENAA